MSLPEATFIAQTKTIQDILSKDETKYKNLETIIGGLNHIALIIPLDRLVLPIIRLFQSNVNAFSWYRLRLNICDNLKLHMKILQKACKGISMNLLNYCEPTPLYLTDTCKIGMGGLSSKSRAWRWQIPKEYWGRALINLLEFCVDLVSIWINTIEDTLDYEE